jgi:hypothetical protein
MGKYSLLVIGGLVFAAGTITSNLNQMSEYFVDDLIEHYESSEAGLIANSMAHMSLAILRDSSSWRGGYSGVSIGDGSGWATVEDSSTDTTLSTAQVRIIAGGSSGGSIDTTTVIALLPTIPPAVHGGVTANSVVTELGNMTIDGRNHDLDGNVIAGEGTFGVSTVATLTQRGNAKLGGTTVAGLDYAPSKNPTSGIIEEGATYSFPSSPDAVFGHDPGTLKALAQAGADGSQYVTDPATLTFPLSSVTYVELADGATWSAIDFGASTGVLVVHNSVGNATIKNLNSGSFKGLIIADDIEKIHTTIIGAVISLTQNPSGNCIGNGNGEILYSSAALIEASSVSTGGDGGVSVVSWLE